MRQSGNGEEKTCAQAVSERQRPRYRADGLSGRLESQTGAVKKQEQNLWAISRREQRYGFRVAGTTYQSWGAEQEETSRVVNEEASQTRVQLQRASFNAAATRSRSVEVAPSFQEQRRQRMVPGLAVSVRGEAGCWSCE